MKMFEDENMCPKCGYFLIKRHSSARCAKNTCGFEMSWEEYHKKFSPKLEGESIEN